MIKHQKTMCVVCALFVLVALVSCDDFFSTSWGEVRKYDLSKIHLSVDNLETWKNKSVGNPALAKAIVEKIIAELGGKSGAEKALFQKFGVQIAIEQSGIGTSIVNVAGSAMDKLEDLEDGKEEEWTKDLLVKVEGALNSGDVKGAAANIANIVGSDISDITEENNIPEFTGPYAGAASASDVGMAVLLLSLAVLPDINVTNLNDIEDSHFAIVKSGTTKKINVTGDATPEEKAFAAYMNLIAADTTDRFEDNPITSKLKPTFGLDA